MTHWPLCDLVSAHFKLSIGRYSDTYIVYQGGCGGRGPCSGSGLRASEDSARFGQPVAQPDSPPQEGLVGGAT